MTTTKGFAAKSPPPAPTFEDVDAHVNALTLPAHDQGHKALAFPDACTAWRAGRPILSWATFIPMPSRWRAVLDALFKAMDEQCA